MKTAIIISFILAVVISLSMGYFIRDWRYLKYDRVCVEPVTDSEVEKTYGEIK